MSSRFPALPVAEPNMTPMIDVLLVLIIVFMVMVTQVYHTMDVQLPEECPGLCVTGAPIVLEVLPGPTYRLNRAPVPTPELRDRLVGVYRDRPDKTLQVAGYPGVPYNQVIDAMDLSKAAGVRVIGIAPKSSYLGR